MFNRETRWPTGIGALRCLLVCSLLCACAGPASRSERTPRLTDIRSLVPDIDLDIRYFGSRNFLGEPVDGYEAPKCLLKPEVANALAKVEQSVRASHHRLRIFDCYRPKRAVAHFMRWARDLDEQASKAEYYPRLSKSELVPEYIADVSGHSRADTVDLTLLRCAKDGRDCQPLDMGTTFDFFDELANTDSPGISAETRENRQRLLAAMSAQGFVNYPKEWWHFSLRDPDETAEYYDQPVR